MLLALDHSRQEPWGRRHGQAFAAFALQHPVTCAKLLDRAWAALYRIYVLGEKSDHVFGAIVGGRGKLPAGRVIPARSATQTGLPAVTIADLVDFAAATYPARLDAWCRASLATWGVM